jgi:hypothetical protein
MKAMVSGAVALLVLVLIDRALFHGKYTMAGRVVLDRTATAILR